MPEKESIIMNFASQKHLINRLGLALAVILLSAGIHPAFANFQPVENPSQPQSINPDWKNLGITWRVSVASDGTEGNGFSYADNAISADGRYVVFSASSYNLVPGDAQYGFEDVFLHDNQTRTTERISVSSSGVPGNEASYYGVDVSADGRYVVFASKASNLVAGDNNVKWDIFLRDRQAGTTQRVSVSSAGAQANGNSWQPRISDDGSLIVYTSEATNLVSGDTNGKWDIFAWYRLSMATERISVDSDETQANGTSGDFSNPAVSSDGRYVAFTSEATNLAPNDTNASCDMNYDGNPAENCPDVFVRDRTLGVTERVSVNSEEVQGNQFSISPDISDDGRYVVFNSAASNLVANDTNTCEALWYGSTSCPDVFVRDRSAGTTERVSVSSSGAQSTKSSMNTNRKPPAISGDGRIVVFESADTTLAEGATNGYSQLLAHNRQTHLTTLVSASTYRWQGNSWSECPPDISADGRYVSFPSSASDLVSDDANSLRDIFVRDRDGWTYAVAGTVRDGQGKPVAGIKVGYGNKVGETDTTDSNGEYELYYMPSGAYHLVVKAAGWFSTPGERVVSVPPTTVGIDFVIAPASDFIYLPVVRR
jgi:hypothetical protein